MSIILRDATAAGQLARVDAAGQVAVTMGTATLPVTAAAPLPVTVGNANLPVTVGNASLPVTAAATLPVAITDNARTSIALSGVALAVGATGVETALTLSMVRGTTINSSTTFATPAGKQLRVQALLVTMVGSVTATAYNATWRLRYNATGAVTTTSPVLLSGRLSSSAAAYSWQQWVTQIPDEYWLPAGDGTAQFGFTVNATYTTNPPTIDVALLGFEV